MAAYAAVFGGGMWLAQLFEQNPDHWWLAGGVGFLLGVALDRLLLPREKLAPKSGYHFSFDDTAVGKLVGVVCLIAGAAFVLRGLDYKDPVFGGVALGGLVCAMLHLLRVQSSREEQ